MYKRVKKRSSTVTCVLHSLIQVTSLCGKQLYKYYVYFLAHLNLLPKTSSSYLKVNLMCCFADFPADFVIVHFLPVRLFPYCQLLRSYGQFVLLHNKKSCSSNFKYFLLKYIVMNRMDGQYGGSPHNEEQKHTFPR